MSNRTLLGPWIRRFLLEHLVSERQTINDAIPAGLPSGTRVAHKTGDIARIWHDAAIVLARRRPFVLIVLTRGLENPKESNALYRRDHPPALRRDAVGGSPDLEPSRRSLPAGFPLPQDGDILPYMRRTVSYMAIRLSPSGALRASSNDKNDDFDYGTHHVQGNAIHARDTRGARRR